MSSSESSVEVEGSGIENVSEDAESTTTATAVSIETSAVPFSQRPRASRNPQVSETVVPGASSDTGARNSSPVSDDVFSDQSATNAILEELELMRPTYVFSEDTVRAEGMSSCYVSSAIDFSSSCESEEDSDSCISPPASSSSMRRSNAIHVDDIGYVLLRIAGEGYYNRPNTIPSHRRHRRRRPAYRGLRRNPSAFRRAIDPTLF